MDFTLDLDLDWVDVDGYGAVIAVDGYGWVVEVYCHCRCHCECLMQWRIDAKS